MELTVTSAVLGALLVQAREAMPNECCGLLFGGEGAIDAHLAASNIHPTPHTHFEIDPRALFDAHRAMRAGGPRLAGYYHSHPFGSLEPSATDLAMAQDDSMIWAIIGTDRAAFWRLGANGFDALSYTVISR